MQTLAFSVGCSVGVCLMLVGGLVQPASSAPTCFGRAATIVGTSGRDNIEGTSGSDVIVTFGGPDNIDAGSGKDWICSGRGRDYIKGERGHDRIKAGSESDSVQPGAGRDRVYGNRGGDGIAGDDRHDDLIVGGKGRDRVTYALSRRAWVDLARGLARWNGRDRLRSIENAGGTRGSDVLRGDSARNELHGGIGGKDLIAGRGGHDVLAPADPLHDRHLRLYGGSGVDLVSFERMRQVEVDLALGRAWIGDRNYLGYATAELHSIEAVRGSRERDVIRGDDGPNHLIGGFRRDILIGRGGEDLLFGEAGGDILIGGHDNDLLDGGARQDFISFADDTTDLIVDLLWGTVTSSEGADMLVSVEGAYGTPADDEMRGNDETNIFFGLGGNDVLQGAAGDDWLEGNAGTDDADGGEGQDTCIDIESSTNCERFTP